MRRWVVIFSIPLLVLGYVRRDAPRPILARTVGVLRPTPFSHKFCGWKVRDTRVGTIPNGEVRCTWYRLPTAARRAERDELYYHIASRNLRYAYRSWMPLSRAAWLRDLDSVRVALERHGGVRSCAQWSRQSDTEVREYWRFPEFEVRLFTGETVRPQGSTPPGADWYLFLNGVRGRHRECRGWPELPDMRRTGVPRHMSGFSPRGGLTATPAAR